MTTSAMQRRGRPLVFLLGIGLAWVGLRIAMLSMWPDTETMPEPVAPIRLAAGSSEPVDAGGGDTNVAEVSPAGASLLEPPPPAHLGAGFGALASAAAHNAMWMEASRETMPYEPAARTIARSISPDEEF